MQCVALSSDDSVLAAGDVTGRVLIWRDFAAAVPADLREGVAAGKRRVEVGAGLGCVFLCVSVCVSVCVCLCVCVCVCAAGPVKVKMLCKRHTCTHTHTHTCKYTHEAQMHTYTRMYTPETHMLTHTHTCSHTHTQVPPPLTTLHWHPAPVGCLTFSPDTTYLLSGGREGVLVLWQLETNRPNFLPR